MNKEFKIIHANALVAGVPKDLVSLCFLSRPPEGPTVRLYVVGDIGFSGRIGGVTAPKGFSVIFEDFAPLFVKEDIVFGNLEVPLTEENPCGKLFAASTRASKALSEAGFTLLHLANNHIYDYGAQGLMSTLSALRECNISPLGAGTNLMEARKLLRTDRKGVRIGWLGCGRTLRKQENNGPYYWEFSEGELLARIREARRIVDVLIVSIHIGLMYLDYPDPKHRAMATRLAAEGADLILMHHAHVLQGVEVLNKGSVICYNLGNFLLDWEEGNVKSDVMINEQREGAVFLFELDKEGIFTGATLPIWIDDNYYVRWAIGKKGLGILDRLSRISRGLDGNYYSMFWRQRSERNVRIALKVLYFHINRRNWSFVKQMLIQLRPRHLALFFRWIYSHSRASLRRL